MGRWSIFRWNFKCALKNPTLSIRKRQIMKSAFYKNRPLPSGHFSQFSKSSNFFLTLVFPSRRFFCKTILMWMWGRSPQVFCHFIYSPKLLILWRLCHDIFLVVESFLRRCWQFWLKLHQAGYFAKAATFAWRPFLYVHLSKIVSFFEHYRFYGCKWRKADQTVNGIYIILSNTVSEGTTILHQGVTSLPVSIDCLCVCLFV